MKITHKFKHWFPRLLGVRAITLYPFVLYAFSDAKSYLEYTIQHELVHVEQIQRVGWFKFYFNYLYQYVHSRLSGYSHKTSYRTISFEAAAFKMQYFPKYDNAAKMIKNLNKGGTWKQHTKR